MRWERHAMTLDENKIDLLRSESRFVLSTHISSDGDGIGSELALGRGLKRLGREVFIVNPTPVPENLTFLLDRPEEILTLEQVDDPAALFTDSFTVILDMGALDRLGPVLPMAMKSRGILVIDHHHLEVQEGMSYLLDTSACATGQVTVDILDRMGIEVDFQIAEPIYAAIHTDTGGFRYPGTTPETHNLAARLLAAGISPQKIYTEIYERQSLIRLKLSGIILSTLDVCCSGAVAHMELTSRMLKETGASVEDGDDLVNYTLLIDGVVAGFYFKELGQSATKVSCRSRGDFPINEFVSQWGGGGHIHAAGVRMDLPLREAKQLILTAAEKALQGYGGR